MDFEKARFNMVEQQIRPWDVLDQTVLNLLFKLRREDFVAANQREIALADLELPIGHGQKMWQPKLEARVAQELAIKPSDRVLDIGSGSGYLAALLAGLARHVYSVEIQPELAEQAKSNLARAGIKNVTVEVGDAVLGWDKHSPYDVIVAGASMPVVPDSLKQQLAPGGRMFVIVGSAPVMSATLITRDQADGFGELRLFETMMPPLQNAPQPSRFTF
ncbi:protein-L-isoaspartate O-methyltransferase family protein [Parachitinimonas caeni]|uniref:Protein-L-isoaspartate O-methyltransferase n=1 Tax=Parachitinimonas caeni TaxID=3031301 RepID=A0ABT7DRH4_9NEIS|nr:protein-L-isoaspartate O-methyltransferase [Parachitinimonas caeni]MDK2122651.1 protein-L-isoaspartate O-methyltransferase [Parachitinimonas caeni]